MPTVAIYIKQKIYRQILKEAWKNKELVETYVRKIVEDHYEQKALQAKRA